MLDDINFSVTHQPPCYSTGKGTKINPKQADFSNDSNKVRGKKTCPKQNICQYVRLHTEQNKEPVCHNIAAAT